MIFFTTYVTIIRRDHEQTEKRRGSPARVEGSTVRLPIGTDVQPGDYLEYRLSSDEQRRMLVIDVIHPHMHEASTDEDHIEVTGVPSERVATPGLRAPVLHKSMSVARALVEEGRMSEAVFEALRLVEERVRSLTASDDSGHTLMESVFGSTPPQLNITTATGQAVADERESFRLLFSGVFLALVGPHGADRTFPPALDETLEYLATASMLMRLLDRVESRLG
jgi:uncharacterized protein (TIGR02391 family)